MPRGIYKHKTVSEGRKKGGGKKGRTGIYKRDYNKIYTLERNRKIGEKMRGEKNPMKRIEVRKKVSEKQKGQHHKTEFQKGHKVTEDTKNKIRKFQKGRKHPHSSEETKQKIREWHINNPNRKFKDTSIELKIEAELKRRGINYQKQIPLCKIAIVDFYLPEYRIVIQCDGDYWHNKQGAKEKDEKQDKVLTFNGFNVYRFWEHEINKSVKECIDKLFQNKLN